MQQNVTGYKQCLQLFVANEKIASGYNELFALFS